MSDIPKRGSKLMGYYGVRLPIHNVNGRGSTLEVANMWDLHILHYVR